MTGRRDSALFRAALERYSNGPLKCASCGRSDDLSIDHIVPRSRAADPAAKLDIGRRLWARLKREGYPDGYAVLCRVCNTARNRGTDAKLATYPADKQGRPLLQVSRRKRHDVGNHYYNYAAWAGPGDSDYDSGRARATRTAWTKLQKTQWWERPRPPAPFFKPIDQAVRDYKIRFEVETGLRLPLMGRRGQEGFVQLLRAFYAEEFYLSEPSPGGGMAPARKLRHELRPYCIVNRWPESNLPPCPRCGMPVPTRRPKPLARSRCAACGAPYVEREDAVLVVVQTLPEWGERLRAFAARRVSGQAAAAPVAIPSAPERPWRA